MESSERRNLHLDRTPVILKNSTPTPTNLDVPDKTEPLLGKRFSMSELPTDFFSRIKQNLGSGIIVALVNLPLSISLAVAAKSTPQAGVITAIISGFIGGIFGGSDYNIIGPTGALSGFLANAVVIYQSDNPDAGDILPVIAIWTGILTFLVLILQLQKYVELFPSSVNEGFTLGVAIIIFVGQLNNCFGLNNLHRHENLIANIIETFSHIDDINEPSLILCVIFLGGFFILIQVAPKIPWQAILSIIGIIIGATLANICNFTTLHDKYGDLSFEGHLFIKSMRADALIEPSFYVELMPITLVAILETLISAKIADKMTNTKFHRVQEMVALGLSNIVGGLVGGIPATAALARTALNIKSGGTHKFSSFINSLVMVLVSIFLFSFFKYLPLPVVAAQVMTVAIRMVDYHSLEFYWHSEKEQFWIMITVAAISVAIDTTYGLIIGIFVYLFKFAEKMMEAFAEITVGTPESSGMYYISHEKLMKKKEMVKRGLLKWQNPDKIILETATPVIDDIPIEANGSRYVLYRFVGIINFMNIAQHEEKLKLLPEVNTIFLSLRFVYLLDLESLGALRQIMERLEKNLKIVIICGLSDDNLLEFGKYDKDWLEKLVENGRIWELRAFSLGGGHETKNILNEMSSSKMKAY